MRVVVGKDPAAIQQAATLAAQDPVSTFGSWSATFRFQDCQTLYLLQLIAARLLSLVILAYFTVRRAFRDEAPMSLLPGTGPDLTAFAPFGHVQGVQLNQVSVEPRHSSAGRADGHVFQCYWYQNRYRRDSWWLKLLVLFALACSM